MTAIQETTVTTLTLDTDSLPEIAARVDQWSRKNFDELYDDPDRLPKVAHSLHRDTDRLQSFSMTVAAKDRLFSIMRQHLHADPAFAETEGEISKLQEEGQTTVAGILGDILIGLLQCASVAGVDITTAVTTSAVGWNKAMKDATPAIQEVKAARARGEDAAEIWAKYQRDLAKKAGSRDQEDATL